MRLEIQCEFHYLADRVHTRNCIRNAGRGRAKAFERLEGRAGILQDHVALGIREINDEIDAIAGRKDNVLTCLVQTVIVRVNSIAYDHGVLQQTTIRANQCDLHVGVAQLKVIKARVGHIRVVQKVFALGNVKLRPSHAVDEIEIAKELWQRAWERTRIVLRQHVGHNVGGTRNRIIERPSWHVKLAVRCKGVILERHTDLVAAAR